MYPLFYFADLIHILIVHKDISYEACGIRANIMNDGNQIYVTAENKESIKRLNYYNEIYASINNKKGYLYLDSGEYGNYGFTPYGSD